jgi:hypothetical protein
MLDLMNQSYNGLPVGSASDLNKLIHGVLIESVPIPTRPYYVNYDVTVFNYTNNGCAYVKSSYYIGPYPKLLAEFLLEHWAYILNTGIHSTALCPYNNYNSKLLGATIALKPKKGTVMGVAPTKEQIKALLLPAIVRQLEVYRELL